MSAARLLEKLAKARKLPPGHTDLKKAQEAVDREYAASNQQEAKFRKQLPKRYRGLQSQEMLRKITHNLCFLIGNREPKIRFNAKVSSESGGHYDPKNKEICFPWGSTNLCALIHELTHFFGYNGHGPIFVETERFLMDLFLEEVCPSL